MAFCPNPDCPHRQKIGRPAEFREGFTHCSDCGSPLSEEVIESKEVIEKEERRETPPKIILADLHKRILYTIGFVLFYRVLLLIPVPGIDLRFLSDEQFSRLLGIFGFGPILERLSIVGLGVMPYLSAYVAVEILLLFIQPLKSWRGEGVQGRKRIKEIAFFATFLLALLQGYGLAQGLEGMIGTVGEKIVRNPGLSFRLISALTMTAGTFLMIWIAELITKKGIGHGISILLLAAYGQNIVSEFPRIIIGHYHRSPLGYLLMIPVVVIGLVALILFMEKGYTRISVRYEDGVETYIRLKFTSAGITPVIGGEWLIGSLMTILGFTGMMGYEVSQKLSGGLVRGSIWHYVTYAIIIIFLYYLLASFFYDPKKMIAEIRNKHTSIVSPAGEDGGRYVDRSLEAVIPLAAVYLYLFVFVTHVISRLLGLNFGVTLIITVTIILDLMEELRLRFRGTDLVKVAELHDVPMAGLLKSLFEQKGVPCYLRGYYHRALLYFFSPYIEISVLVPEDRMSDAKEVIETYLDEKILTARSPKTLGA